MAILSASGFGWSGKLADAPVKSTTGNVTGVYVMDIYVDRKPENCNHCIYRKDVSRYFDLDDYCSKTMKHTSEINMETDCPLRESNVRKHFIRGLLTVSEG